MAESENGLRVFTSLDEFPEEDKRHPRRLEDRYACQMGFYDGPNPATVIDEIEGET